jgi:hypothetical protein
MAKKVGDQRKLSASCSYQMRMAGPVRSRVHVRQPAMAMST